LVFRQAHDHQSSYIATTLVAAALSLGGVS
jgi:hypothetical protein